MKIKAVMIDLSGTVHVGHQLLPGVMSAIKKLKERQVPMKYVTNTSKESRRSLLNRLTTAGLEVKKEDIFTSLSAAKTHVVENKLRPLLLLEKEALEDFDGVQVENPNSVVVGLSPSQFHYTRLTEAFNLLKSGANLVAINKSRYYKREDGLAIGTGAFVSALEYAADMEAHVVGKPSVDFFQLALKDLDPSLTAAETLMVGDDVRDDVLGAQKAGMQGALVKTGKYQEGDEKRYGEPKYVFENLEEMADFVLKQQ